MAKRMSDDEVQEYVYQKMFGDLDRMEAANTFSNDYDVAPQEGDTRPNAMPEDDNSGGVKITVEPIMKGAQEGGKATDTRRDGADSEDDDEDKLKGISRFSPLMSQLHGER